MEQAILDFAKQFAYEPTVEHSEALKTYTSFLLTGVGGSHLAADIVKNILPEIDLTIHHDYGVAPVSKEKSAQSLFIASSYSGNTEEVVEGYRQAKAAGMAIAVLATGGRHESVHGEDAKGQQQGTLPLLAGPQENAARTAQAQQGGAHPPKNVPPCHAPLMLLLCPERSRS